MCDYIKDPWEMIPLNGATGEAFMGVRRQERVFFKRNTSPFIATLAAAGYAPRLMWTQRTFSGETLTAQEWLDGQPLTREQMDSQEVIDLIKHLHDSYYLRERLLRVDGRFFYPPDFIDEYFKNLPPSLHAHQLLNEIVETLEDTIDDDFYTTDYVVCHGDLNHNNFMRDSNGKLYLVDWENVKIADPLSDLMLLLCEYYSPSQWVEWLERYDFDFEPKFYKRIVWYTMLSLLLLIKHYYQQKQKDRVNELILFLRHIYHTQ